jgi:hypothetical protein
VLIFFTGGLWLTSIWQWRALKEQAGVAEKAVKAAELALNTELPYVFVEVPKMITRAEPVTDPDPALAALGSSIFGPFITGVQNPLRFAVSYELRNRGKGLAIIDGLKARFHLARTIWDAPTNEEQRRMKTIPLEVRERVIGPADNSINYVYDVYLVPSTWSKILPHKLELVLVGFIRFHDVFERKYRQDFCYRYLVGSFDAQTLAVNVDWFFAGPPKNNKYHRYIIATRIPACPSQNSRPQVLVKYRNSPLF